MSTGVNRTITPTWPTFAPDDTSLDALVKLSRYFGSDPRMVLAGGGNTSVKDDRAMWVKASGGALSSISAEGFVQLDRAQLQALAEAESTTTIASRDASEREDAYKQAILAARIAPRHAQRPSVECLLHHIVPGRFVVHTHPTLVNAITCCDQGQAITEELFGDDVLWLAYVDPGYVLALTLKEAIDDYRQRTGQDAPKAIFMANHGLIVAGGEPSQVRDRTQEILDAVSKRLNEAGAALALPAGADDAGMSTDNPASQTAIDRISPMLRALLAEDDQHLAIVRFDDGDAVSRFVAQPGSAALTDAGPLTPDQIVYCLSFPLWLDEPIVAAAGDGEVSDADLARQLEAAISTYEQAHGVRPRVILAPRLGLFAAGPDVGSATRARELYVDAIEIMQAAEALSRVRSLSEGHRQFIEQWEVEAFRRKVAAGSGQSAGRVAGKVALVTGAAQGFGLEIAQGLASQGACVILADLNIEGAAEAAEAICETRGASRAAGLAVNVTDGESVAKCMHEAVRLYGGLDLVISNAGVLRAESVKTQPLRDFQFVTNVNYTGYFVVTQHASPILARQHAARPGVRTDIIQINSKSGLVGSNRNGAYAGSKFGGIGLTQSFALELVEDGVKVNSICPGNFFDGPLWSDPDNGLFVQYLRTGKVPGAKTIADVRKAYESKVPMGRGCTTPDVLKAIYYLVEQQYETGQAVPVTGGQVMLS